MILRGEKTWEMRSQPCRHRGPIALIEKGTGTVVALARMVDDLPALSDTEMRSSIDKHGIPAADIAEAVRKGWTRPWVLTDVARLSRPVPYEHTSGGSWVNLTEAEEAAVLSAGGARPAPAKTSYSDEMESRVSPYLASNNRSDDDWTAENISPRPTKRKSTPSTRPGSNITMDVWWSDGGLTSDQSGGQGWPQYLGVFAVLTVLVCQLGFVLHLVLGLFTDSFSFFSAFKWLIPMLVAILVAMLTGQGHWLMEENERR